jgi:CubicO group peptidase (beta-lactamase class C family)
MRSYLRLSGAALLAVLLAAVPAVPRAQQVLAAGTLPILDTYLEVLRQQAAIPGMSAAIVKDGVIAWEKGYGFQNVDARIAATPDTPYFVADISQTLASVLLLECVEQRHLDLDTPVSTYGVTLPEPTTTMRQLLSHASPQGADVPFQYNPARFDTLTAVAEHCIPQPYRKSVSHRILERLAMTSSVPGTDLQDPNLPLPEGLYTPEELAQYRDILMRMAVPYHLVDGNHPEVTVLPPTTMSAASGLVTTVRDLAQFDTALDTDILLLGATREASWTNAIGRDGNAMPMGLGWFVQYFRGERIVWHFGLVPGAYSSLIIKVPSRSLTFILLANSDAVTAPFNLQAGDLTQSIFATVFLRLGI